MFSRLALRLAAIEALNPSATGAAGPWPTVAGPRVYDSRIDPIALATSDADYEKALDALENKPLISVYTEDCHDQPQGTDMIWPGNQTVTLVLELMIAARGTIEAEITNADGTAGVQTIGALVAPATSQQHEALLDTLEGQCRRLLSLRENRPSGAAFRLVAMGCQIITSDPQRDGHRTQRLALRTVKFHLRVHTDDFTATTLAQPLPWPLSKVATMFAPGSSGAATCALVAAAAALPPVAPVPLDGIAISAPLNGGAETDGFVDTIAP
jgi:hypothetical protein